MSEGQPRVWVLLGERTGDNNQALALAETLGLPFETRMLRYNLARGLSGGILGERLISLTSESRRQIVPPWPDLVIAIGRRCVPVARWIRRANGGRTKLVLIGHPRIDPGLFDLVITTRQYPVPPGDNVLLLPLAMSRFATPPEPTPEERRWLSGLAHPRLMLAIGGATKYWTLSPDHMARTVGRLGERARAAGGSLIVATSRRTDPVVIDAVRVALGDGGQLVCGDFPRFSVLMTSADEIFVTGDSISMLSEAILTGKPTGLVPIILDAKGRRQLGAAPSRSGPNARRRDVRRFWDYLDEQGLIGTIEQPVAAAVENPSETAARAVRELLGR